MNSLGSILYFAAASVSGFCLVLLLMLRSHIKQFPPLLITLLGLHVAAFMIHLLMLAPQSHWKHLWFFLAVAHSFCLGPFIWLYARKIAGLSANLSALGRGKITLLLLGIFCASPILAFVQPGTEWVTDKPYSPLFWRTYYALASGYVVIYFVQAALYLFLSFGILRTHLPPQGSALALMRGGDDADVKIDVLRFLILAFGAQVVLNAVRVVFCAFVKADDLVYTLLSSGDIAISVTLILFVMAKMIQHAAFFSGSKTSEKYERSTLEQHLRNRIKAKVEACMARPHVVTENNLTLNTFSQKIGEKHHYVSQVINQDMGMSFLDLLNQARVTHAQKLMQSNASMTMVDLAEQVGFNSKTTFYTAFSKYAGTTPAQYKKNLS